jgi:hypothetical protein
MEPCKVRKICQGDLKCAVNTVKKMSGNPCRERLSLFFKAQLLDHANSYEDMLKAVQAALALDSHRPLTEEECDLIASAFKNVVGNCRDALRLIASLRASQSNPPSSATIAA